MSDNKLLAVKRDILMPALSLLRSGVERRNNNLILGNLLAESDGKTLTLTASNLEVSITTRIEAAGEAFSATIPADKLHDIVRLQPSDAVIRLSVAETTVTLSCGKGRYRLQSLPANDYPHIDKLKDPVSWAVPEKAIYQILGDVDSAMADHDVRHYLNGALLEIEGQSMRAVSTNGHRLYVSHASVCDQSATMRQILPRHAVLLLTRLLSDSETPVQLSMSGSFFELQRGETVIRARLIDGRYPDYQKVIPSDQPYHVKIDRESFCEVLRRVSIVAEDKNRSVHLSFDKNAVNISANNSSSEESSETVVLDYLDEKIDVAVNSSYLLDALETLPDQTVELAMRDGIHPIVITGHTSKSPLFVVMPCRA
ncbi:MAG: DNA polymerase III subunit beta [Sulfuricaulis sp.]